MDQNRLTTIDQPKLEFAFVLRFVLFGTIMAFVNLVPYLVTVGTSVHCGVEIAGWPFTCYKIGGITGMFHFSEWAMTANIVVAVIVSAIAGWVFRAGVLRTIHGWRTWGTPNAD